MIITFTSSRFALLLSIAVSAIAGDIDGKTSCAVAAKAFENENAQMERTIVSYIKNTMDAMDSQHAARGEIAIMAQFSDVGLANMAVGVVERCQTHKESTIHDATSLCIREHVASQCGSV